MLSWKAYATCLRIIGLSVRIRRKPSRSRDVSMRSCRAELKTPLASATGDLVMAHMINKECTHARTTRSPQPSHRSVLTKSFTLFNRAFLRLKTKASIVKLKNGTNTKKSWYSLPLTTKYELILAKRSHYDEEWMPLVGRVTEPIIIQAVITLYPPLSFLYPPSMWRVCSKADCFFLDIILRLFYE